MEGLKTIMRKRAPMRNDLALVFILAVVPAFSLAQTTTSQGSPNTILINGKILTVDPQDSVVQAVAIREGKIAAVGTSAAISRQYGTGARVIDLHGQTVTPGLIDAHFHFQEVDAINEIDLNEVASIGEALSKIQEKVKTVKPGEWIRGGGWDEGKLKELRWIYASDIDKVAPNNPVWLTQTMGHYGVANSYALKLAKVDSTTPDPHAGTIDRDANGKPTGIMKESAMGLVRRLIPPYSREQERAGLLKAIADSNKEGLTAVKDPAIRKEKWDLYQELLGEDKLTVHVFTLWLGGRTMESARQTLVDMAGLPKPPVGFGDDTLIAGGIKLYMDGSGGARTGWLYKEWNKGSTGLDKGNVGYPTTDPDVYRQMVKLFHDAGYHIGTHAVGDQAIDNVVDTYAAVLKDKPTVGLRDSVIHANLPTDHAIETMAMLQKKYDAGYPELQPTFMWWIGDTYSGNYGPERSLRINPLHTYLEKGIRWAGGSDYPVTPFAPRYGLWASVERKPLNAVYGAHPFGTAESVDIHVALKSYTIWAAHQLFLENRIGSLEPGKDADLVVWDRDIYTIPSDQIKDMKCELTMFRGRIVYRSGKSPLTTK
jgi:predicted amidohydrolase YtcJ